MSFLPNPNLLEESCSYNKHDFLRPTNQVNFDSKLDWQDGNTICEPSPLQNPPCIGFNTPHTLPSGFQMDLSQVENEEKNPDNSSLQEAFFSYSNESAHNLLTFPMLTQSDYNFHVPLTPSSGNTGNETESAWVSEDLQSNNSFLSSLNQGYGVVELLQKPLETQTPSAPVEIIDLTESPPNNSQLVNQNISNDNTQSSLDQNTNIPTATPYANVQPNSKELAEMTSNTLQEESMDALYFPPLQGVKGFDRNSHLSSEKTSFRSNNSEMTIISELRPPKKCQTEKTNSLTLSIELANRDLWKKFFDIGTEMIITKAGRRMFPAIKLEVRGLKPHSYYVMAVDVTPVDNNRYRYVYHSSQWMAAGTTDAHPAPRTYIHPDSPCRGEVWMRQAITFDKLKLTNHEANKKGHIILNSMHKYQPRVHVIECHGNIPVNMTHFLPRNKRIDEVTVRDRTTAVFPECVFTTVTAYQNQQITKLKIDRNPFAKGFRETNKQWQSSSSEASSVRCCQRKGPERSKEDFDSGLLGGASSFSPQTDDEVGLWQRTIHRDVNSTSFHFPDSTRGQAFQFPASQSYNMATNVQYLDIAPHALPEVNRIETNMTQESQSSFYDLLSENNSESVIVAENNVECSGSAPNFV